MFFWSSEKNDFWSNEIWSHDHFPQKLIYSANWNCLKSFLRKTDSFAKKLKVQENKVIKSLILKIQIIINFLINLKGKKYT